VGGSKFLGSLASDLKKISFGSSKPNLKFFEFGLGKPLSLDSLILANLYENVEGFDRKFLKIVLVSKYLSFLR
jgi:hypothetical protein